MATRTVVFDMDGTLVQTRAASWDVFQDTARRFELPIRSAEEFFELFRGNFYESLSELTADPAVEQAVREHFLQGLRDRYSPEFIPGMRDVVKALAGRYPLAVMSSNAMGAIRRILEDQGLAQCFAHVFAGDAGASKAQQLRQILDEPSYGNARRCSPSYVEGDAREGGDVVLITDTVGDVREARSCGVRAIGVAWGMHSADALVEAGADYVAIWPQELVTGLLADDDAGEQYADGCQCGCTSYGASQGSCRPQPAPARSPAPVVPTACAQVAAPLNSSWTAAAAAGSRRRQRRAAVRDPGMSPPRPTPSGSPPVHTRATGAVAEPAVEAALRRIAPLVS